MDKNTSGSIFPEFFKPCDCYKPVNNNPYGLVSEDIFKLVIGKKMIARFISEIFKM